VAPASFRSLLVALLVIGGCARLLPPPRQELSPPVRAAVGKLAERWNQFSDLRSLATMELTRPDGRDRFTGVLLVKSPASLRFEALSPFGQPFLFLVLHDDDLIVYNAAENEALLAPATADSMAKLVSLPFEPADLVSILAGRPAPPADLRRAELADVELDKGAVEGQRPDPQARGRGRPLVLVGPNHEMRVWMDLETGIAHEVEISGGRYEVSVRYERDARGELSALTLSAPRARIAGRIDYQEPAINTGVDSERFTLVVPPSAKVERLR
jgi:outer membrane lipoprotein-sorting protein